jgi:hypothetical protein
MSNPWKVAATAASTAASDSNYGVDNYQAAPPSLSDIMSEQLALNSLEFEVSEGDDAGVMQASVFGCAGGDAAAAVVAQRKADEGLEQESLLLAIALQKMEDDACGYGAAVCDDLSKGNIQSSAAPSAQHQHQHCSESGSDSHRNLVQSSGWGEAEKYQLDVSEKSEETQRALYKHDPVLRSLQASTCLSEMKGVGDMKGLLVDHTTSNQIKEFSNKIEKNQFNSKASKKKPLKH